MLVRAYAWLALLQRTGVINQLLQYLGIIEEPLALVHNTFGTVVATVHILLPFMVLPLYATMQKIPARPDAGRSEPRRQPGARFLANLPAAVAARRSRRHRPWCSCCASGFYITPELLGGGRTLMVSMLVSRNVELYNQWGAASAVGVVLLISVSIIFFVVSRFIPLDRMLGQR